MSDTILVTVTDWDGKTTTVDKFTSYEIVHDYLSGPGRCTLVPTHSSDARLLFNSAGQKLQIKVNGALQFTGIIDETESSASEGGGNIQITARDALGLLSDCTVQRTCLRGLTFLQLAQKLIEDWTPDPIQGIITNNAANYYRMVTYKRKVRHRRNKYPFTPTSLWNAMNFRTQGGSTLGSQYEVVVRTYTVKGGKDSPYFRGIEEPTRETYISAGETILDVLKRYAAQIAHAVWMTSDGWLCIVRPRYDEAPYTKLVFKTGGVTQGLVKAVTHNVSIADRFGLYRIRAQGRSSKSQKGRKRNRKIEVKDPGPAFWKYSNGSWTERLHKVKDFDVKKGSQSLKRLRRLARTRMEESAVKGFQYQWELHGHTDANGALWAPDACVDVEDEVNNRKGRFWIASRNLRRDPDTGSTCVLNLVPEKIWLYNDHDEMSDTAYLADVRKRIDW